MDRGAWWAAVHGVSKNQRWLSNWKCILAFFFFFFCILAFRKSVWHFLSKTCDIYTVEYCAVIKNNELGLPWWFSSKESTCQCRRHRFDPWSRGDPICCGATKPVHKYWASALEPGSGNYRSPWAREPVLHNERPLRWEACPGQLDQVAPATREKPVCTAMKIQRSQNK